MIKQLYLDLQNIFKAVVDDQGNQIFKHFDLWNQNVEFIQEDSPFEFPALFVEFVPFQWQTLMNRAQQAEIVIRLHVVTNWLAQTAEYSPVQTEMLEYLDLPDKLYDAIQSHNSSASNGLMRTNSIINHNHGPVLDSIEEYKTLIVYRPAAEAQTLVSNVIPVITNQLPT